jgi:putative chitinase
MNLRNGSRGEEVRQLQSFLGGLTADGVFGPRTETAVRQWQQNNRFPVNGVVDSVIWETMFPSNGVDLKILSGTIPSVVIDEMPNVMREFNINTPLRVCHFLAQCAHESGNFRATRELLNYSAQALTRTWPRRFPADIAQQYARNPEMIANRAYADRMENGPEASGDGWRFRGRGYIQLTGRANYRAFNRFVQEDILENPDLVASKYPLLSAAWFWNSRNLNNDADTGASDNVVTIITRKVNGGTNGLDDRIQYFRKFNSLFQK